MKKLMIALFLLLPTFAFASTALVLQKANTDISDLASLQNGAKLYVNYCMGCHSLQYQRFQRLGADLGLSDDQLKANLMFSAEKVGELMTIAMKKEDGKKWFGVAPPDLSVTARARGVDWLYTYLLSFYADSSKATGVNNLVFPDVAMPHVLSELQGWQKPVYETIKDAEGKEHKVIKELELVDSSKKGAAEKEYRKVVYDLVNFLDYVGEPAKLQRQRLGVWVLLFIVVFFVFAYALKKEYWRDVH
jgi:ubiquinol-cytochrome c reductase cytochrome c1 subunit